MVISLDGARLIDECARARVSSVAEAAALGHRLADVLKANGAEQILAEVRAQAEQAAQPK